MPATLHLGMCPGHDVHCKIAETELLVFLTGVQRLVAGTWHLDQALTHSEHSRLAVQSPYWVSNDTGCAVDFWLVSTPEEAHNLMPGVWKLLDEIRWCV